MAMKVPLKSKPNEQPTSDYSRLKLSDPDAYIVEEDEADLPALAVGGIYIFSDDVQRLTKIMGVNFFTSEELVNRVKTLTTISVSGAEITLSPALLNRLKSRALKKPIDDYLREEVVRLLSGAVGI